MATEYLKMPKAKIEYLKIARAGLSGLALLTMVPFVQYQLQPVLPQYVVQSFTVMVIALAGYYAVVEYEKDKRGKCERCSCCRA
jgi:hypothetical protein